ncbi:MAG TPA: SulP family inorganic anion transporter [Myxococcales bacterium]|jgi:SulP family sulfate permease
MSEQAVAGAGTGPAVGKKSPLGLSSGDVWGGVAAMLVAFPSAIAFGVVIFTAASPSLAGAGAFAGLVGAAALGLTAPLVGRNAGFVTAPCAPAAAVMSGLAASLAAQGGASTERLLGLLVIAALISAALQIAYGVLGVGKLIKFIPFQVVSGYLSGVAVIIAVAQLPRLLGVAGNVSLLAALGAPARWSGPALVVGVATVLATAAALRLTKRIPAAIVGLAAGLATYFLVSLAVPELRSLEGNRLVVGPISAAGSFGEAIAGRLSALRGFALSDLALVAGPAATLSVLLSIDTLKTGVVLDAMTRTRHDSNRELLAQGVANVASAVFGGVPGAGSMGPSLINVTSGCRSPWGGVVEGVLILCGFLALGSLMAWVPIPALAGILLVVAFRMFDFRMFRLLLKKGGRLDFAVIASVIVVAEGVGLIQASVVGVCLSILLFIREQIRETVIARQVDLTQVRSTRRRAGEELKILADKGGDGLLVQLKGDLFFGTTDQLLTKLEPDLNKRRLVLLDCRRVESMDYTAAHLLEQMQERLAERGGQLLFSGMPSGLLSRHAIEGYLRELGVVGGSGGHGGQVFETRDGALEWMEERILESAGWSHGESRPPLELGEIAVFQLLGPAATAELAPAVQKRSLFAGEPVFEAGDTGDELFFVRSGRVHIDMSLGGEKHHHLATISRGEYFGEIAFLDRQARSANAHAATPAELFALRRADFDAVVEKHGKIGALLFEHLAKTIALRLRLADVELRSLEER